MWEVEANGHMTPHVAKFYKTVEDDSVVFEDAKLNMVAESFAHNFNVESKIPQKVSDFLTNYGCCAINQFDARPGRLCSGVRDRNYRLRNRRARSLATTGDTPKKQI